MGLSLYPMGPMLGLKESGTQSWLVIHGSQKRTIRSHEIRCFLMFLQSSHGIWRYLNYGFNHLIIILIIMIWEESGTLSMDNTYKYPWLNPYSTYNVPIHWEHDIGYGSIQKKTQLMFTTKNQVLTHPHIESPLANHLGIPFWGSFGLRHFEESLTSCSAGRTSQQIFHRSAGFQHSRGKKMKRAVQSQLV